MRKQTDIKKQSKGSVFRKTMHLMFINIFEHNVGKNAAALAYYLLFALFPLLIFVSNLLGLLSLNISAIIQTLQHFLPNDVVGIIENYLDYVSTNSSHTLMWFSLIFSIWFPMRAAKGLMDDVRRAYGLKQPQNLLKYTIKQLIYTVVLLVVIVLTLLLSILGENVLSYINELLPDKSLQTSEHLLNVWQYLRFLPIIILMFIAIGTLYDISLDHKLPIKTVLPGIIAAMLSWLVVSIGFSFFVENFANYSVIYGTLGTVIVMLIWLYLTAMILILGAEFNAALQAVHSSSEN